MFVIPSVHDPRAFLSNFSREGKISAAGRRREKFALMIQKISLEMAIRILMRVCQPIVLSRRGTNAVCQAACKTFCKTLCYPRRISLIATRACQVSLIIAQILYHSNFNYIHYSLAQAPLENHTFHCTKK